MDTVLLLISSRHEAGVSDAAAAKAAEMCRATGPAQRLASHVLELACEEPSAGLEAALREVLAEARIDVAFLPLANRRKQLLIADMDSTFIHQECIDELGKLAGAGEEIAAITERAMRGELDFSGALRERVALMAGLDENAIETVKSAHVTFTDGGRDLVQGMRTAGAYTALVSGGFTHFTAFVAEYCGFDENRANRLIIENGTLTGRIEEPALGRDAKVAAINELAARQGITLAECLAVGDGANDIGMLEAAGLGVAFHAKPAVREAADVRIDHAGLDALLWLQGLQGPT
ncbi:MAG: phosphoserine phosphatase SerB [Pseudomonadota bacterium]